MKNLLIAILILVASAMLSAAETCRLSSTAVICRYASDHNMYVNMQANRDRDGMDLMVKL